MVKHDFIVSCTIRVIVQLKINHFLTIFFFKIPFCLFNQLKTGSNLFFLPSEGGRVSPYMIRVGSLTLLSVTESTRISAVFFLPNQKTSRSPAFLYFSF